MLCDCVTICNRYYIFIMFCNVILYLSFKSKIKKSKMKTKNRNKINKNKSIIHNSDINQVFTIK